MAWGRQEGPAWTSGCSLPLALIPCASSASLDSSHPWCPDPLSGKTLGRVPGARWAKQQCLSGRAWFQEAGCSCQAQCGSRVRPGRQGLGTSQRQPGRVGTARLTSGVCPASGVPSDLSKSLPLAGPVSRPLDEGLTGPPVPFQPEFDSPCHLSLATMAAIQPGHGLFRWTLPFPLPHGHPAPTCHYEPPSEHLCPRPPRHRCSAVPVLPACTVADHCGSH